MRLEEGEKAAAPSPLILPGANVEPDCLDEESSARSYKEPQPESNQSLRRMRRISIVEMKKLVVLPGNWR